MPERLRTLFAGRPSRLPGRASDAGSRRAILQFELLATTKSEQHLKISLLSFDLSGTCVIRAHLLARMLVTEHEVEIVGPASAGDVWEPLRHDTVAPFRVLRGSSAAELAEGVDGDLLYALKPRPTSLGVAIAANRQRPRPLVVDVDDWETGFLYDDAHRMLRSGFRHETKWVASTLLDFRSSNNFYRTALASRHVKRADAVTASSRWLAGRYGGAVIPQSRDTAHFDPSRVDRDEIRGALGIAPDKVVLLFMGGPRRHKGLNNVLAAMDALGRDDLLLLVVGGDPELPPRPDVQAVGWQPYSTTNRFLAAADMVVLAHDASPGARGQMPTKLYDAMAMGCPIVVSDVSDMAEVAEGCGLVVPPGDVAALADAVRRLADDPTVRRRLGATGRDKCVARYSDDAVRPELLRVIELAVAGERGSSDLSMMH
jgi:glycosyltransferase involved in cell wall biosynthesis